MLLINIVLLISKKKAYSGALFINDFNLIKFIIISIVQKVIIVDEKHNLSSMNIKTGNS